MILNFLQSGVSSWLSSSQGLSSLTSLMDAWYDGTSSGTQLNDVSGNGRHATLTRNLVTDGGAEYNSQWTQVGAGTAPSVNTTVNTDSRPGSTGTRVRRLRWESVAAFGTMRSEHFILVGGQTVTLRIWTKRVTSTTINVQLFDGVGPTQIGTNLNTALATNLVSGSQTVGSWAYYEKDFTPTNSTGLAYVAVAVGAGTHELLIDDLEIVVKDDATNIAFILPDDATLKSRDTKNQFYTSAGVPLTTRAAYQYNANVNQIFCGGAFEYIFTNVIPSASEYKILREQFIDYDHAWSSCPLVYTVGSGQTYTTYLAALNAWTSLGTFRHRVRFDLYSDLNFNVYADYTIVVAVGQGAIILNKEGIFLNGVGGQRTITGTKAVSSTDAQLLNSELFAALYTGGVRNIKFVKSNGGYLYHQDNSGMINGQVIIKDCEFVENGGDAVFAYRTANALAQPTVQLSNAVLAGGMQNGFRHIMDGVTMRGKRPFTWQDDDLTTGQSGRGYYYNLTLESLPIYDVVDNVSSQVLESIRLTSSGVATTNIYLLSSTRNSTVNKVGAIESIFLTEQ